MEYDFSLEQNRIEALCTGLFDQIRYDCASRRDDRGSILESTIKRFPETGAQNGIILTYYLARAGVTAIQKTKVYEDWTSSRERHSPVETILTFSTTHMLRDKRILRIVMFLFDSKPKPEYFFQISNSGFGLDKEPIETPIFPEKNLLLRPVPAYGEKYIKKLIISTLVTLHQNLSIIRGINRAHLV